MKESAPNRLLVNCWFTVIACFPYVGEIPDDRGFDFLLTIPDFADISDIRQRSVPDFADSQYSLRDTPCLFVIG